MQKDNKILNDIFTYLMTYSVDEFVYKEKALKNNNDIFDPLILTEDLFLSSLYVSRKESEDRLKNILKLKIPIIVFGSPGVGKTSLIHKVINDLKSNKNEKYIDVILDFKYDSSLDDIPAKFNFDAIYSNNLKYIKNKIRTVLFDNFRVSIISIVSFFFVHHELCENSEINNVRILLKQFFY
jgi:Cdc6-like AAA superfamily ATPase